ncbi:unnamed protein product, partial [Rotaria sp. Silwood1]
LKWNIQHEQRHQPSIISNNPQISSKQKKINSMNEKIDTYIRHVAVHLHTCS